MALVVAVTAVFVVTIMAPDFLRRLIEAYGTLRVDRVELVLEGAPLVEVIGTAMTLITYAFVHFDVLHWLVNCGFLLAFGSMTERLLGPRAFLVVFMASVVIGGIVQVLVAPSVFIAVLGASAGVSGAMGAAIRAMLINPALRQTGILLVTLMLVMNLFTALMNGFSSGGSQVAWQAHLAGFATGFAIAYFLIRTPGPPRRPRLDRVA